MKRPEIMSMNRPLTVLLTAVIFCSCVKKKDPVVDPSRMTTMSQNKEIGEIAEIKQQEIDEVTERELRLFKDLDKQLYSEFYQTGIASWYGGKFQGRRTSNGEVYDMYKLTAAHKTLPFNTIVEVNNLESGKKIIVRINDRGPFIKNRIIDLSYKAARGLGIAEQGLAPVGLRILNPTNIQKHQDLYVSGQVYYLQAGAFSKKRNAERMLKKINRIQSDVVFRIVTKDGYFKVVSEKISPRSRAEKTLRMLDAYNIDAFIKEYF